MSYPLPPSAALPLTEGENKLTLHGLISPREGETRAQRARGSLTPHLSHANFIRKDADLANGRRDDESLTVSQLDLEPNINSAKFQE